MSQFRDLDSEAGNASGAMSENPFASPGTDSPVEIAPIPENARSVHVIFFGSLAWLFTMAAIHTIELTVKSFLIPFDWVITIVAFTAVTAASVLHMRTFRRSGWMVLSTIVFSLCLAVWILAISICLLAILCVVLLSSGL